MAAVDAELERAFLTELEALERFRMTYRGAYPNAPLSSDDPDVRRLIEALAFFTAKTKLAGARSIDANLFRIFREHFPYLLSPTPTHATVQASVTRRYAEVSSLPAGSAVHLVKRGTAEKGDDVYYFQTLSPLKILPVEIERVATIARGARGYRVVIEISTWYARSDPWDQIELYVDYLSDLHSSLLVIEELRSHVRSAQVVWAHDVGEDTPGEPCQISFGKWAHAEADIGPFLHPMERTRAAFHFPEQELFFTVKGIRSPRQWQRFTICLDLDENWPPSLQLNGDCFRLHVVPVVNIVRATASPIEHDETKGRYPIVHPERPAGFVPISVRGVFQGTQNGLVPLEPSGLATDRPSFDCVLEGAGADRKGLLSVNLPGAFESKVTLVADMTWHQPRIREVAKPLLEVRLGNRFIDGIEWEIAGNLGKYADPAIEGDRTALLQLLSIKGQRLLDRDGVKLLLRSFGINSHPAFAKYEGRIEDVRVIDKPHARKGKGFKHIYEIRFGDLSPSDIPKLNVFGARLFELLALWSPEEVVELTLKVPNLTRTLKFEAAS